MLIDPNDFHDGVLPASVNQELPSYVDDLLLYQDIFTNSSDGIWVFAVLTNGKYLHLALNHAAELLFNVKAKDLIGKRLEEVLPEQYAAEVQGYFKTLLEKGEKISVQKSVSLGAIHRILRFTFLPNKTSTGMINRITLLAQDITALQQAEIEIRSYAASVEELTHVAARLSENLDVDLLLSQVCEETARIMNVPVTNIRLLNPETNFFQVRAAWGVSLEVFSTDIEFDKEATSELKLYNHTTSVAYTIASLKAQAIDKSLYQELGFVAAATASLNYEDELIGIFTIYTRDTHREFSEGDLALLTALADQISIAIRNAQLFEQIKISRNRLEELSKRLVEIQETESRRLAIELHDEFGQTLTHLKLSLDRINLSTPLMAAQLLSTAKNLTNQLIRDVRNISLELRPTILDDLGLLPAFLWHFDRYTSLTGIKVNFQHRQVDHRFPKEIETATYRIMQEALTNVARYAGVSEVSVFLLAAQDTLILQIEDQGKGFLIDRSQNSPPTGGISGMQERAQLCGGQLIVESNPGKGTFLSLELPLKALHMERRKNER